MEIRYRLTPTVSRDEGSYPLPSGEKGSVGGTASQDTLFHTPVLGREQDREKNRYEDYRISY